MPKYYPGCWTSHQYFEADKLTAIGVALANKPNDVEIVNIIVKVRILLLHIRFFMDYCFIFDNSIGYALCNGICTNIIKR